jgi:outer membrane protein assembly factor BamB
MRTRHLRTASLVLSTARTSRSNSRTAGPTIDYGSWAALDVKTGRVIWQVAATGAVLFGFACGGSVIDAPSIVNGTVFWGSGYRHLHPAPATTKSSRSG